MRYSDGRTVCVGDRVKLWDAQYGTVVCSIDTQEFSREYTEADWSYLNSGIIIKTDSGGIFHYTELDEDFELVDSGNAP
jgi:hypothetical protein